MNKMPLVLLAGVVAWTGAPRAANACTGTAPCLQETNTTAGGTGIKGISSGGNGVGVQGYDTGTLQDGAGVNGYSYSGQGVFAYSYGNIGAYAVAGTSLPVAPTGVYGVYSSASDSGAIGIYSTSSGSFAIEGSASAADSIHGIYSGSVAASAVAGINSGSGNGVYGDTSDANYYGVSAYTSASGGYSGYFGGGRGVNITGDYYQNGTCVAGCPSDQRLKKNIEPLTGALDRLLQLRGVTYEWKNPEEQGKNVAGTQTGFIAQDVEKVFPSWVGETGKGFKTMVVQPSQIGALEVEAIRTLKVENDSLKAENLAIKKRLEVLENGHPVVASQGFSLGGSGWGFGALALVGSLIVSRRRKAEHAS